MSDNIFGLGVLAVFLAIFGGLGWLIINDMQMRTRCAALGGYYVNSACIKGETIPLQ